MNKHEKYKVLNFGNSVCCLTSQNKTFEIPAWSDDAPGFTLVPFEDIEYASARTALFKSGLLGFEDVYRAEIYSELHIDEKATWTKEKIHELLVRGKEELRRMVLEVRDLATMGWIRSEMMRAEAEGTPAIHSIVKLVNARNLELMRGQLSSRLNVSEEIEDPSSVKRDEFEELKRQNEELNNKLAQLMGLLESKATEEKKENPPAQEVPEQPKESIKPVAKRGPKKKE